MARLSRRTLLKGVSAGTSGLVLAPLLQTLEAQAAGTYAPPKRVKYFGRTHFTEAGSSHV